MHTDTHISCLFTQFLQARIAQQQQQQQQQQELQQEGAPAPPSAPPSSTTTTAIAAGPPLPTRSSAPLPLPHNTGPSVALGLPASPHQHQHHSLALGAVPPLTTSLSSAAASAAPPLLVQGTPVVAEAEPNPPAPHASAHAGRNAPGIPGGLHESFLCKLKGLPEAPPLCCKSMQSSPPSNMEAVEPAKCATKCTFQHERLFLPAKSAIKPTSSFKA
eukprot:1158981-Pelagomonas_calceolata.AAC.7